MHVRHGRGRRRARRQTLEPAHDIVRRIADKPTRERETRPGAGGRRPRRPRERLAQQGQELRLSGRECEPLFAEPVTVGVKPQFKRRVTETDEGIAPQALTALHALEQEGRLEGLQLQERRDRRVQIA